MGRLDAARLLVTAVYRRKAADKARSTKPPARVAAPTTRANKNTATERVTKVLACMQVSLPVDLP